MCKRGPFLAVFSQGALKKSRVLCGRWKGAPIWILGDVVGEEEERQKPTDGRERLQKRKTRTNLQPVGELFQGEVSLGTDMGTWKMRSRRRKRKKKKRVGDGDCRLDDSRRR